MSNRPTEVLQRHGPERGGVHQDRLYPSLDDRFRDRTLDFGVLEGSEPSEQRPQRAATWLGRLLGMTASHGARTERRRAAPSDPLLSLSYAAARSIDLNIEYKSEIEPYLGPYLGAGGFGKVYQGMFRGMPVAVKVLEALEGRRRLEQLDALRREVEHASRLNSERLVQVYGASLWDETKACLVMELCKGGNLKDRIHSPAAMTHLEILQVARDVAEGLSDLLHSVVHLDLKPENILLDTQGRAKISDFGIARAKDLAKTFLSTGIVHGTFPYMAPEHFVGRKCGEKCDVYALGVIVNECITRRHPWQGLNEFQIFLEVVVRKKWPGMDPRTPPALRRLIKMCWAQEPENRSSSCDILKYIDKLLAEATKPSASATALAAAPIPPKALASPAATAAAGKDIKAAGPTPSASHAGPGTPMPIPRGRAHVEVASMPASFLLASPPARSRRGPPAGPQAAKEQASTSMLSSSAPIHIKAPNRSPWAPPADELLGKAFPRTKYLPVPELSADVMLHQLPWRPDAYEFNDCNDDPTSNVFENLYSDDGP